MAEMVPMRWHSSIIIFHTIMTSAVISVATSYESFIVIALVCLAADGD